MSQDVFLGEKIVQLEKKLALFDTLEGDPKVNNVALKALFDVIPVPFVYKDCNGLYQQCNDLFAKKILGVNKEEVPGKSMYDFPDAIPKENADIYRRHDIQLLKKGGQDSYEALVKCADGVERYYLFCKSVLEMNNRKVGITGLMLDISRYRNMLTDLDNLNSALNELSL